MEKLNGLRCREFGRHYPAAPIHVCEFCFGPSRSTYRYDALQRPAFTRASIESGAAGACGGTGPLCRSDGDVAVRPSRRLHAASSGRRNPRTSSAARECGKERSVLCHPSLVLQGPEVVPVAVTKAPRVRRFDTVACASTGNLANSGPPTPPRAGSSRTSSSRPRPRAGQDSRDARYNPTLVAVHGHLRRGEPALLGDRRQVPMGVRQRELSGRTTRKGIEELRLRDRRAAGLGAPPAHIVVPCAAAR